MEVAEAKAATDYDLQFRYSKRQAKFVSAL